MVHTILVIFLVIFGLGLAALCIFGYMLKAIFSRQETTSLEDEARLVQDMYRTMNALEQRVAVLETLLAERAQATGPGPHGSDA